MKFFVSLLLIALLSFASGLYLPWWMIAVTSFTVSLLIPQRPGVAFLCGFLAVFILWFAMSVILSSPNEHMLAGKISMMILKINNPWLLIAVTALLGGIVSGLASLTASLLRRR